MSGRYTAAAFEEHHREHPQVYARFCYYALKAAAVRRHYSAKAIMHRVRWETEITEADGEFKVNDGWISHYARMFLRDHPEHEGFFETRHRKGGYHEQESKTD